MRVYNYANHNNLDIVQFSCVSKNGSNLKGAWKSKYQNSIKQPKLSSIMYYYKNSFILSNNCLWNRIIKKTNVLHAYDYISEDYLHKKIKRGNDMLLNFAIFRTAKSFAYVNEFIYCYNFFQNDSVTKNMDNPKYANRIIIGYFIHLKFLFEKLSDIKFDKMICIYFLKSLSAYLQRTMKYLTEGFEKINEVFLIYLNCKFFDNNDKKFIIKLNKYVNEIQKNNSKVYNYLL